MFGATGAAAVPTKNPIRLKIIEHKNLVTEGSVLLPNRADDRVPGVVPTKAL